MGLLKRYKIVLLLIPLISVAMHFRVFKLDLIGYHAWRQTQTQTGINNFYKEDFNILNPKVNDKADTDRIMRMEFPVMQWVYAWFFKMFGDDIMISRILTFIIGLFTVLGMFILLRIVFKSNEIAAAGAWAFNFSPVFYYYTLNPLPDNLAMCCAIWSMTFLLKWVHHSKARYIIWSAIFLSLATLAKLPFILYGSFVVALLWVELRYKKTISLKQMFAFWLVYLVAMLPAIVWYISVIPSWIGNGIVTGIITYTKDQYTMLELMQYHLVSTLPELLLNYGSLLFFILGLVFIFRNREYRNPRFYAFAVLGAAVIFYFVFEINMIAKVHDYYLFPFMPLLFVIVAYGIKSMLGMNRKWMEYLCVFLLLVLPVTAYLRINSRWDVQATGFNNDLYTYKKELRMAVPDTALCIVGNDESHYVFLYYINKKGWVFKDDTLAEKQLNFYIEKGAKYLYTDSKLDTTAAVKRHLDKKVAEKGTIRVYLLKEHP